jgi:TRAF3-interacting protein 1
MSSDIAVKRPPDVRVSKILAGQEADKTNLLLQALAEAINLDVDTNEVVRKTLQTLGDTNENEEAPRSREPKEQERSEKHRSKEERSSKSREREEPIPEKKTSSREASRVNMKTSI